MKFSKILIFFIVFIAIGITLVNVGDLTHINTDLNTKLEQTEKSYSYRIDSMTAYQEGLVAKINELNEKNQKLKESYNALQASYDELDATYKKSIEDNNLHVAALNAQIEEIQKNIAELEKQLEESNSENSELKKQVAELKTKVANLEQSINEKNATIEQLNSTIETQKATIENLNKTISDLNSTIEDLTNDLNSDLSSLTFYKNLMEGEVTEITAEDLAGVTKIRDYAFFNIDTLTSAELPNNITSIGFSIFEGCDNLSTLIFDCAVSKIPNGAFRYLRGLSTVEISGSVTSIGSDAFSGCSLLNRVSLPYGLLSIDDAAFDRCDNLSIDNMIIPSSIVEIVNSGRGQGSFYDSLNSGDCIYTCVDGKVLIFDAPTTITDSDIEKLGDIVYIASKAFESCINITKIDMSKCNHSCVYSSTFKNCTSLNDVVFPKSVTSIGYNAFCGCTGLTAMSLPNSIEHIYSSAFDGCSNLSEVSIDSTICTIGEKAFYSTKFLTNLQENSDGIYTCNDGKKIVISSPTDIVAVDLTDVVLIADYAYANCTNITSVEIPSSVYYVGAHAFYRCSSLTSAVVDSAFHGYAVFDVCFSLNGITFLENFKGGTKNCRFSIGVSNYFCNEVVNLRAYYFKSLIPPVYPMFDWSSRYHTSFKIYVPNSCVNAYKENYSLEADYIYGYSF